DLLEMIEITVQQAVVEIHSSIDFDYAGYTAENLARFERAYQAFEQDR
ncbi:choline kinase, partial [Rhizobium leguminosarum]